VYKRQSLLFTDPSVDGMKTGYTAEAGYCMITSAQRQFPNGPRRLLTVVMGTPTERARGQESQVLLNWAYQNFDDIVLASPAKPVLTATVWKGTTDKAELGSTVPVVITVPRGMGKDIQTKVVRPDPLVAPLAVGQRIGQLDVSISGKPLATYPLQVLKAVPEAGLFGRAWDSLRLMIK